MFLREINPGDVFEDSSFDQIGLQVNAKVKLKFDEYGKIVSLGSVNGVLSSYDSNNLKFALNSLEENKVDTSSIKVQPFSEEGYEYWARDFTEYSDQAMQLNQQLLGSDFFGIPTLNPNNIAKPSNIPQFTCFNRKYTFSDPESVIFTSQLLKEPLDNFIMYRPQRVLLHEVAARLLSVCQFDDEKALHSVVNKIVRSGIQDGGFKDITKEFDSGFEKLLLALKFNVFKSGDIIDKYKSPGNIDENSTTSGRQLFQYLTEDEVGIVAETLEKIRSYETGNPELAKTLAGKDGKYIPLKHILATKLQVNRWRKLEFHKDVQLFAKQIVDQYLKDKSEVKEIDYVPCKGRQTVFVNGGVSSGKGSVNNLREEVFQKKGVESYLTFNKDSVKGALYDFSKGKKTQRYLASQLCQTEASEIMNRVKREIEESIYQKGVAPHMLVDMVYQSPTDMDLAIKGEGSLRCL